MDNLRIFWLCSAIFPITLASALAAIYGIRLFCRRNGFVDRPDGERKTHKSPVALGGGIAVLAAVGVGFAAAFGLDRLLPLGMVEGAPSELMFEWDNQWLMLIMCGASIAIVGLIDDWFQLRGRQKLLAQIVIVSVLAIFSQQIDGFAFFGIEISLGAFAIPVSIVWLLGSVNALNLIDGADGMATTTGAIISAGLAAMAFIIGDAVAGIIALCMCAALIGFFCFNRPPATIYLGDAGSMMIGLILGTLALWISAKETTILAVAPVAVLSVPLFDSAVAILRRWLTGRSIYTTDRGHLHHCLLQKFTPWQMLGLVVLMCGATTTASVISVYMQREWIAVAGAMGVLVLLVVSGVFGRRELQLLMDRVIAFLDSFVRHAPNYDGLIRTKTLQIQGERQWDDHWQCLRDFAESHGLCRMKLDLNIPWLHEGFQAVWSRGRTPDRLDQLVLRIPIVINQKNVGRVEVMGLGRDEKALHTLDALTQQLLGLQEDLRVTLAEYEAAESKVAAQSTQTAPSVESESTVIASEQGHAGVVPISNAVTDSLAGRSDAIIATD